jgi:hypothetical protein
MARFKKGSRVVNLEEAHHIRVGATGIVLKESIFPDVRWDSLGMLYGLSQNVWPRHEKYLATSEPSNSGNESDLLSRAMLALDDYLNAGSKPERQQAAVNAKALYREYYGAEYVNRNKR